MKKLKKLIKDLAKKVYKELGSFGFIEEARYETALAYEFRENGMKYLEQVPVDIMYRGQIIKRGEVDFIVFDEKENNAILLELKAIGEAKGSSVHQILKYFEAIKDESGSFPRKIAKKVKGGLVLNWVSNKGQEDLLKGEFVDHTEKEYISEDFEWLEDKKKDFEIFEVELNKEIDETEEE